MRSYQRRGARSAVGADRASGDARLDARSTSPNIARGSISCGGCSRRESLHHPAPAATSAGPGTRAVRRRRADGAMDVRLGRNAVDAGQSRRADAAAARLRSNGRAGLGRRAAGANCRRGRSMPRSGTRSAVDMPLSTYRLQLSKDFGFDDAARIVPYLKSLGITPSLHVAVPEGAARQHARLRRRRSRRAQSGVRRRGSLRAAERRAEERRARADPRLRAQPHGGRLRQRLVDGRAGMGPEIAARGVVRHQLGAAAVPARRRRAAAGAGQALWRRADGRRDRAEIRCRRGQLFGLVFRPPLSDQSAALQRHHQDHRRGGARRPTSRPAARCWRSPTSMRGRASPSYAQAPALEAAARRHRRRGTDHRARACRPTAPITRPASTRCTACWSGSTTASPTGGSRCPASTTGAFSTSTSWPACASRTRARSATCTSWWRG